MASVPKPRDPEPDSDKPKVIRSATALDCKAFGEQVERLQQSQLGKKGLQMATRRVIVAVTELRCQLEVREVRERQRGKTLFEEPKA